MDSKYCNNFQCSNIAYGHWLRCSECRRVRHYICAMCNTELRDNRQIRCDTHRTIIRGVMLVKAQSAYRSRIRGNRDIKCNNCGVRITDNAQKYCSENCRDEVFQRMLKGRRQNHECLMCFTNLDGTGKRTMCSEECYGYYRRLYNQKRNIDKEITIE